MKCFSGEDVREGDVVLIRKNDVDALGVVEKVLAPDGIDARESHTPNGGVLISGGGLDLSITEKPETDPELIFVSRAEST